LVEALFSTRPDYGRLGWTFCWLSSLFLFTLRRSRRIPVSLPPSELESFSFRFSSPGTVRVRFFSSPSPRFFPSLPFPAFELTDQELSFFRLPCLELSPFFHAGPCEWPRIKTFNGCRDSSGDHVRGPSSFFFFDRAVTSFLRSVSLSVGDLPLVPISLYYTI